MNKINPLFPLTALAATLLCATLARADNECGAGPEASCDQASYANGISYQSSSDLTVTKTNSGTTTVTANGINLTGTGGAALTWDSRIGAITGGAQTQGPVIDALTDSGDITLHTLGITGSAATVTHGIRARSTGGGSILIDASHGASDSQITATNATSGLVGVEAISQGGDGDVEIRLGRSAAGEDYGVYAEVAGAGNLTISTSYYQTSTGLDNKGVISASGTAALYARTGTGLLTIDARTNASSTGTAAGAIIDAGGDVLFTGSARGGSGQYGIELLNVVAGTTSTLNLTAGTSVRAQGEGELRVNIVNWPEPVSFGQNFYGSLDFEFSGMAEQVPVQFRDGGIWRVTGTDNVVPEGNYAVSVQRDGMLVMWEQDVLSFAGSNPTFGIGEGGYFAVDARDNTANSDFASEVRVEGLAEFRHAGRILLGSSRSGGKGLLGELPVVLGGNIGGNDAKLGSAAINYTDGSYDDVLVMPGVHWVGEGGEIWFDLETGRSQDSCTARDGDGRLAAADCLMLEGATTEGVTYLTLFDRFNFDRGRLNEASREGILLVDVSGGTSAQGHFVVGPNTRGYSPAFGGSWDQGLFQYVMSYDEDSQQHRLVGMLSGTAFQQAQVMASVQDLWRSSIANWQGYQADLRQSGVGGEGGIWLRTERENGTRDRVNTETAGGASFDFDNSVNRNSLTTTAGLDLLSGEQGDLRWSTGLMLGYVTSELDYDRNANSVELNGWSYGLYGGVRSGAMWLDAALNVNQVTMRQFLPGFQLEPRDTLVSNDVVSFGGQVDAGWRMTPSSAWFVEPMLGLSYVRSDVDALSVLPLDTTRAGLDLRWDAPTSLRGSLGGRFGMDRDFGVLRARFTGLVRVWNEFDGETVATIHNNAYPDDPDHRVTDAFDGAFTEIGFGTTVHTPGGGLSGYLNLTGRQATDYRTFGAAAGVRLHW